MEVTILKRSALIVMLMAASVTAVAPVAGPVPSWAAAVPAPSRAEEEKSSSAQMMETIEQIVYGDTSKGGLIERLGTIEEALFGRSLPGTIAERHAAILNFLEVGTEDQPSMMFKLGVAEWIVDKRIYASRSASARIDTLEMDMDGSVQYGRPIAMRVERILATLVTDPVTFRGVLLPTDTPLELRFMDELSPAKSQEGDQVRLELTSDLIVDQCLVAPAGSLLLTEVREVKKPGMFGVPGEVRLTFNGLKPLGPQRPQVAVGAASQKAIDEARKVGDRGEGAIVGAGAASIAGAALLGPVGLVSGLFIRGNSIRIPEGSITFVQTSGDIAVSAYPIPATLRVDPRSAIQQSVQGDASPQGPSGPEYDPDRDTIIKGDVFNRRPSSSPSTDGTFDLSPEERPY